jgi:ABC-2 type transport system permease protein
MSVASTIATRVETRQPDAASGYKVTFPRVVRSEWIKLRSVRSTVVTLALTGAAVAALGVLITLFSNDGVGPGEAAPANPVSTSLFGVMLAQLVMGVLGAVLMTGEFSTGQIRATFTAVPERRPVLWAKSLVGAGAVFVAMAVAVPVAFLGGQAVYGGVGGGASLFDPGVPRALLGAALLPAAIAVMGIVLGALTRHTATTVGILFATLFIGPLLLQSLGGTWVDIASFLPSEAGQAMMAVGESSDQLSPLAAFGVMAGWVAALVAAAGVSLARRDP